MRAAQAPDARARASDFAQTRLLPTREILTRPWPLPPMPSRLPRLSASARTRPLLTRHAIFCAQKAPMLCSSAGQAYGGPPVEHGRGQGCVPCFLGLWTSNIMSTFFQPSATLSGHPWAPVEWTRWYAVHLFIKRTIPHFES
jgi:hypothetical protein